MGISTWLLWSSEYIWWTWADTATSKVVQFPFPWNPKFSFLTFVMGSTVSFFSFNYKLYHMGELMWKGEGELKGVVAWRIKWMIKFNFLLGHLIVLFYVLDNIFPFPYVFQEIIINLDLKLIFFPQTIKLKWQKHRWLLSVLTCKKLTTIIYTYSIGILFFKVIILLFLDPL